MQTFTDIPTLNMAALDENSAPAIQRLHDVCHSVGFFYLEEHDVSFELMQTILDFTKQFFALPQSAKDAINIANSRHFRGYGKLNAEITQGIPDYKETYDLGLEHAANRVNANIPYSILLGPNQWPQQQSLQQFKTTILHYIEIMQQLGFRVMRAIAQALDFDCAYLNAMFSPTLPDAYALLRLLHYPPSQNLIGVGPHTDAGFLVFLLQDSIGGLEVQNAAGEWIAATPKSGKFIVNLGEMLEAWSNGYYRATRHRVINTSLESRYSAPFFYEPHLNYEPKPGLIYGERILSIYRRSYPNSREPL